MQKCEEEQKETQVHAAHAGTKRVAWVDFSRVIAILLIVQCHTVVQFHGAVGSVATQSVSLALFFILSGYFDKACEFTRRLRRLAPLCAALLFYSLLDLGLHAQSVGTPVWELGYLWFLRDVIICSLLNHIYGKLPRFVQLLILLLLYTTVTSLHSAFYCTSKAYVALFYFAGAAISSIPLQKIPHLLLFDRCCLLTLPIALICFSSVFYFAIYPYPLVSTPLCYLPGVWGLLCLCHYAEKLAPKFVSFIAKAGPGVIFIYLAHIPLYRALVSLRCRMLGYRESIPDYQIWIIIILIMVGCPLIYKLLCGRNKWVDMFFFGR